MLEFVAGLSVGIPVGLFVREIIDHLWTRYNAEA